MINLKLTYVQVAFLRDAVEQYLDDWGEDMAEDEYKSLEILNTELKNAIR